MRIIQLFILISVFSLSLLCYAETPIEERGIDSDYWGLHIGRSIADIDFDDGEDFEYNTINARWGRQFSQRHAFEVFVGLSDKEKARLRSLDVANSETNMTQMGLYGLYTVRKNQFFANGRLGIGRTAFVYSESGSRAQSKTGVGLSYGFNAGFRVGDYRIQLDYNVFPTVEDPVVGNNEYDSNVTSIGFNYDYN